MFRSTYEKCASLRRTVPRLEALEDRSVPAVTASLSGGVLSLNGTDGVDLITVRQGAGQLVVAGVSRSFPVSAVSRVEVRGSGGADAIDVSGVGVPGTIDGGAGVDRFRLDQSGPFQVVNRESWDQVTLNTPETTRPYTGTQQIVKMASAGSGFVTLFSGGGAYFSPDGWNLGGGGNAVLAYTGSQRVVSLVAAGGGVVTLFSGGGAYFSPDGRYIGGGGQTRLAYTGTQRVVDIVPAGGGVVTRFSGGGVYFSPDGRYLGGGGNTVLAYTGSQKIIWWQAHRGGVLTQFSKGGVYFSPNGRKVGGGDGTKLVYLGTQRVVSAREVTNGVLTLFIQGGLYFSPDGNYLGGGGQTALLDIGSSAFTTRTGGSVWVLRGAGSDWEYLTGGQPSATLAGGVLTVIGTGQADAITITSLSQQIQVAGPHGYTSFSSSSVTRIVVQAGRGNDRVDLSGVRLPSVVNGGAGNDQLYGGGGADTLMGSTGNDGVFGGSGADTLRGGAGADRFLIQPNDVIQDSNEADATIPFLNSQAQTINAAGFGPVKFAAGAWRDDEIIKIDAALNNLHHHVGNIRLLELANGRRMAFVRFGRQLTLLDKPFGGFNNGEGSISITESAATGNLVNLVRTVYHEVGHNWDGVAMNRHFAAFVGLSGWRASASRPGANYLASGANNDNLWYLATAAFARDYGRHNPQEDYATTWETYFTDRYHNNASDNQRVQAKLNNLDLLFADLR